MGKKLSRREFIKIASLGTAASAVITGCGPASRYVVREPYTSMPEYTYNGRSTFYATTCRECAAGCGVIVRTMQGRAIKVEGNKNHPLNLGKTCARGQTSLQGLYNPDRVQNPIKQARHETLNQESLDWEESIKLVAESLTSHKSSEVAFLLGMMPDHLFDLVTDISNNLGYSKPLRYGALGMFDCQATIRKATNNLFKNNNLPHFDIGNADVIFSFGANFLETWLSPVAMTHGYSELRKGVDGRRGRLIQFEPRLSQTAAVADKWIPINPGTEGFVALGLGRLIAENRGVLPYAYRDVNLDEIIEQTGIDVEDYDRLARLFANAKNPLAIPGGGAASHTTGLENAEMILNLNILVGNIGQTGGVYLAQTLSEQVSEFQTASISELDQFIADAKSGKFKVLFIHGVNPIFELPKNAGFKEALGSIPMIISFSSYPDETALSADYILPDHTPLEAWGYQYVKAGTDRVILSGSQPVVAPYYNTRATADVILAAIQSSGGKLGEQIPFEDEVEYIKHKLLPLVDQENGLYKAPEINTFFSNFQQFGGWWLQDAESSNLPPQPFEILSKKISAPKFINSGEFYFLPFVSPILGEAGANKPSLQEIPDPTTSIMWNSWVEINPETAKELDIHEEDVVKIISDYGEIEAAVYIYPGIRPDTIAMPFGQGHTAYGRYAASRGVNPIEILGLTLNEAGDLAFGATKVNILKTGRTQKLARLASPITDKGIESH